MKQLKVEHNAQPSSDLACLEVKTANESFKDATPREEEELHQIPRLFALIIGINVYQMKHRTLRGAVPDGMAFKSYLMKRLCVPKNQIITLFDHDATRTVIIEHGFRKLRDRLDVGFFKLYLSTKPIDLSGIKQPSAFLETCTTTSKSSREVQAELE
ncbi:hypothetical protein M413DRAFT_27447 [Hebeloma cylindrosporum]|uniref:Uncharacterized protein n=1 Tax=Hebeloma cylindrosporum TaxID=76867 RepID=A0A0C2YLI6_HEBCY|nr:hypothetical protein M413DRAFT_27447 [Hebeloma cylindrosporum h7]